MGWTGRTGATATAAAAATTPSGMLCTASCGETAYNIMKYYEVRRLPSVFAGAVVWGGDRRGMMPVLSPVPPQHSFERSPVLVTDSSLWFFTVILTAGESRKSADESNPIRGFGNRFASNVGASRRRGRCVHPPHTFAELSSV